MIELVVSEETGERREVRAACLICFPGGLTEDVQLVSPSGLAHASSSGYGVTDCGHDATGDSWWWRL